MILKRGLVTLLAVTVLTGCTDPGPDKDDPKVALTASTAGLTAGNYHFTVTLPGQVVDGSVDDAHGRSGWTIKDDGQAPGHGTVENRVVDGEAFHRETQDAERIAAMKESLGTYEDPGLKRAAASMVKADTGWTRLPKPATPATSKASTAPSKATGDVTGVATLIGLAHGLSRADRTIRGTIDATVRPTGASGFFKDINWVGAKPAAPFTVTLDDQGRIVKVVVDLAQGVSKQTEKQAGSWTLEVGDYGTATGPAKPAKFTDAPGRR